jgi:hypothetical protein
MQSSIISIPGSTGREIKGEQMNENSIMTKETPGQLTLDELIKHGRLRMLKEKTDREAREAEEIRKREKALASIDIEMQKAIPPVLLPLLKPYNGRSNLSADMKEKRCVKYSEVASIYVHLIFFNGKQWELDTDPHYEVVEKYPNDDKKMTQYIGSDLAMALAIAANITSDWEQELKVQKPEPVYEPVDGSSIDPAVEDVFPNSPFTAAQDKYLRKVILGMCNQFFGG